MYKVQLKTFALSLLLFISLVSANPVSGPLPEVWDNLNGTAGEPLSPYEIYLADELKLNITIHFEPISTRSYYDSISKTISDTAFDYFRINTPININYSIPNSFEIGLRIPYVVRISPMDRKNTSGFSDFSLRVRKKIIGDKDSKIYFAIGGGVKFPTAGEVDYDDLLLSYRSFDLFLGAYTMVKTGIIKYPIALTYSHTGRGMYSDRVGEIITYRVGLITDLGHLFDFNLGLKGYEIPEEGFSIHSFSWRAPHGSSKTSVEAGINIQSKENRLNFSAGIIHDLRGKRSYIGTYPFFSMQVNF
ncbi:MAG: hypothetical protein OEW70_08285 [candidate division WOR-3 bacterium]|nr:hypothetical protein [candidate division WOR-3 bacterium]